MFIYLFYFLVGGRVFRSLSIKNCIELTCYFITSFPASFELSPSRSTIGRLRPPLSEQDLVLSGGSFHVHHSLGRIVAVVHHQIIMFPANFNEVRQNSVVN